MGLRDDAQLARDKGLKFKVTRKAARGARWQTVVTDIEDLEQAVDAAKAVDDYESGVFTSFPPKRAGYKYWSSMNSDLLNSTVITMEIHYDEPQGNR